MLPKLSCSIPGTWHPEQVGPKKVMRPFHTELHTEHLQALTIFSLFHLIYLILSLDETNTLQICMFWKLPLQNMCYKLTDPKLLARNSWSVSGPSPGVISWDVFVIFLADLIHVRAELWKKPLVVNCAFEDCDRHWPKNCSTLSSESRHWPNFHGSNVEVLVRHMTNADRLQLCKLATVCDAMKQEPAGTCFLWHFSAASSRNRSKQMNPASAASARWSSVNLLFKRDATQRPTSWRKEIRPLEIVLTASVKNKYSLKAFQSETAAKRSRHDKTTKLKRTISTFHPSQTQEKSTKHTGPGLLSTKFVPTSTNGRENT